jgi:hypothetical protein
MNLSSTWIEIKKEDYTEFYMTNIMKTYIIKDPDVFPKPNREYFYDKIMQLPIIEKINNLFDILLMDGSIE